MMTSVITAHMMDLTTGVTAPIWEATTGATTATSWTAIITEIIPAITIFTGMAMATTTAVRPMKNRTTKAHREEVRPTENTQVEKDIIKFWTA